MSDRLCSGTLLLDILCIPSSTQHQQQQRSTRLFLTKTFLHLASTPSNQPIAHSQRVPTCLIFISASSKPLWFKILLFFTKFQAVRCYQMLWSLKPSKLACQLPFPTRFDFATISTHITSTLCCNGFFLLLTPLLPSLYSSPFLFLHAISLHLF